MLSTKSASVERSAAVPRNLPQTVILWVAIISAVIGAIVRLLASRGDLWFDEIWTLGLLSDRVRSLGDIFTNFKHSNNHHLSSIWMWLIGPDSSAPIYRLPSVLSSIATIALAGLIGGRRGRLEGCVAVTLVSWSYLLIHFGTEARGYSGAICFALLAWYALQRFEDRRSWLWIALFWGAVVLGFLAHLEFLFCFAGLGIWSVWRFMCRATKWTQGVIDLLKIFLVPSTLGMLFYLVAIRGMEFGGGEPSNLAQVLTKTASYMVGGPGSGNAAAIVALLALVLICTALFWLIQRKEDQWLFYLTVIAPLLLIAFKRPDDQLYVRYFLVSVAMALLLYTPALTALLRSRSAILGVLLLAAFICGNAINIGSLLRFGRGQYLRALRFMEEQSRDPDLLVTSDHDERNALLINYFKRYLARPDRVRYLDGAALEEESAATNGQPRGPEWLIVHRFELTEIPERLDDIYGSRYQLMCVYRYSDLSGWHWLLYHNLNRPGLQPTEPLLR